MRLLESVNEEFKMHKVLIARDFSHASSPGCDFACSTTTYLHGGGLLHGAVGHEGLLGGINLGGGGLEGGNGGQSGGEGDGGSHFSAGGDWARQKIKRGCFQCRRGEK